MRRVAMSVPGVQSIHDLSTRQSAGHTMLDLHVVVAPRISVSEGHEIGNEVSRRLETEARDIDWLSHVEVRRLAGTPYLPATG
ncbi:cation transporter dimerization domain-containing protein [Halomonas sp.]|uniref:cation transporter dimerization domain-containing protein n=1 Tax=Halomonas sp. TaxID=1486246 RepID=UPI0038601CDA